MVKTRETAVCRRSVDVGELKPLSGRNEVVQILGCPWKWKQNLLETCCRSQSIASFDRSVVEGFRGKGKGGRLANEVDASASLLSSSFFFCLKLLGFLIHVPYLPFLKSRLHPVDHL